MTRRTLLLAAGLAGAAVLAAAQQPPIQNGRVERRSGAGLERELAALAGRTGAEAAWALWRVPLVDGERDLCCWYTGAGAASGARGCFTDPPAAGPAVPAAAAPPGPVPLEAGTGLLVLVRLIDGRVERVRTLGDDCPIDANGRAVHWLEGVTPAESLRVLEAWARTPADGDELVRRRGEAAVGAIALHRDSGAGAALDRLAAAGPDIGVRRQAASWLGQTRGAHGFESLRRLAASEPSADLRRHQVNALGETRQPGTADALLAVARGDADARVRGEAIYWYPQRAGLGGLQTLLALVDAERDATAQRRAVSGLARLPAADVVPHLIALARTNPHAAVRKEAVTRLGQVQDPRATAFLEEILKR